jgi:hypothetical protein
MTDSPQPESVWFRIERARNALGWNESRLGSEALKNRTGYTKIKERGWSAHERTQEKIITRLEQEGYSGVWLRAGVLPEKMDGSALPERPKVAAQLARLARKLCLDSNVLVGLWVDMDAEGPLEKYPDELQRAAFAVAYLDNRTLEDVRRAVDKLRSSPSWKSSWDIDKVVTELRYALREIKPSGSGTMPIRLREKIKDARDR